jgi:hypothetical protein
MSCLALEPNSPSSYRIALASNLDAEHISSQVYELLGYCPVAKRVRPGLLAEGTYAQIRESMVAMLVRNGLAQDDATRVSSHLFWPRTEGEHGFV